MCGVDGTRETRPMWMVMRFKRDERGIDDNWVQVGSFWNETQALTEQAKLDSLSDDPSVHHEVIRTEATVVYPADESPPWVADPDRLAKRGYERPEHACS
jgi:hypothetical protein